jgi:NACHT domain
MREPGLTLQGALQILGRRDKRKLEELSNLLGGVILAGGVLVGLHAFVGAIPAAGLWAAIFGLSEQKNTAMELLTSAVDRISGKRDITSAHERRELIVAAHTTIVVAAFFEALSEELGPGLYDKLKVSDNTKETLLTGEARTRGESVIGALYAAQVPMPSPVQGFEETVAMVRQRLLDLAREVAAFLAGLSLAEGVVIDCDSVVERAVDQYRWHYFTIAAKVPEFGIWALVGEDAATRALIRESNADLAAVGSGVARIEALLALTVTQAGEVTDLRRIVENANRGALNAPIVDDDDAEELGVIFPKVGDAYVSPRFRVAQVRRSDRPADARWWQGLPPRADFDLMLAAYVLAPDATRLPLLLLGDPGAGKSMLAKVFAARLLAGGYSVVRVPLRRVDGNATIPAQIRSWLYEATHRTVDWGQFCEQTADTVRVVILDGLDELLQAGTSDRSAYLNDIEDFQQAEADQGRPVIVIVTSRIGVAERVPIPAGTTVVKLDPFTDDDVADWLSRWRAANAAAVAAGTVRALAPDAALRRGDLARQPLLLLMLALYTADPALPALDDDLPQAALYERLLEEFARREARKTLGRGASPERLREPVRDHLDRLAVAALAMFNRGRQDATEEQVGADLVALGVARDGARGSAEAGQRVIGEFLFVHAAEGRQRSGGAASDGITRRSYEFLHATFGEYLVASFIMGELISLARQASARRRGAADLDDGLLFALLSHQPLAARGSVLDFARQTCDGLADGDDAHQVRGVLTELVGAYRDRHGSNRFEAYRPTARDTVRELACYSANLVSLRVALAPEGAAVPLADLARAPGDELGQWRSTVRLWQAGLDADGLSAMLTLQVAGAPPGVRRDAIVVTSLDGTLESMKEILLARLAADPGMEQRTRYGAEIWDGLHYEGLDGPSIHDCLSGLIPAIVGRKAQIEVSRLPGDVSAEDARLAAALIFNYLRVAEPEGPAAAYLVRALFSLPREFTFDTHALARAVIVNPSLADAAPELRDPKFYGDAYAVIAAVGPADLLARMKGKSGVPGDARYPEAARAAIQSLLHRGPVIWEF